ncbi:MAG TPA: hypothetical protein PLF50_05670 [Candidatus Cloacimonadota bacterium]|nr:hypothetical protein [Candidatus Cloacimonadota bacterium]
MLKITSTDIEQWSQRISSRSELPELIRRLILTTIDVSSIEHISFAIGEDIGKTGYDGVLKTISQNPYVPLGKSVWEISTQKNVAVKANSDYQKRTEQETEKKDITYVIITSEKWKNKDNWIKDKNNEGQWKEVKAFDALDLELWLSLSIPATLWFGELIGKLTPDFETLESYATGWFSTFRIPIPYEIALAGRQKTVSIVQEFLKSSHKELRLRSLNKDESVIFLFATIKSIDDDIITESALANSVVVKSSEAMKHWTMKTSQNMLIIPLFPNLSDIVIDSEKRYMIPLAPNDPEDNGDMALPKIHRDNIYKYLKGAGISEHDASVLSMNSGGSLSILRRLFTKLELPSWAKHNNELLRLTIPMMFVQSWNTEFEGDNAIIERLSSLSKSDYESKLTLLINSVDSPLDKIGKEWRVSSVLDLYFTLLKYTIPKDWDLFKNIVLEVFNEINPELDLEPEKRYAAAIYGKKRKYSEGIRKGIAQSLTVIALYGHYSNSIPNNDAKLFIDYLVKEIFTHPNKDIWYSLGDVLPLLAEASPQVFIKVVEDSLNSEEKSIIGLFTETDDFMTSRSQHHQLLWALEALAWDSEYFQRAVLALCRLTILDPGGKYSNRPFNSLHSIFRLWMPQTEATTEIRFKLLSKINREFPDIGWSLSKTLLPQNYDVGSFTYRYKWRELSKSADFRTSRLEYYNDVCCLIDVIIPLLNLSVDRWSAILEHYTEIPPDKRYELLDFFKKNIKSLNDPDYAFYDKIREFISKHRTFKDAVWALPEEEIQPLEDLFNMIEPQTQTAKYKYLFDDINPELIDGKDLLKKDDKYLDFIRNNAVKDILDQSGFSGLVSFCNKINYQHILANAVDSEVITNNISSILDNLESENLGELYFSQHLIRKGTNSFGQEWSRDVIDRLLNESPSSKKLLNLLLSFDSDRWLWDLIDIKCPDVKNDYWSKVKVYPFNKELDDVYYVINELIQVNRFYSALDIAHLFKDKLQVSYIVDLLNTVATSECSEKATNMVPYYIEELLEIVQNADEIPAESKQLLEWRYINIITLLYSRVKPISLLKEMSQNPEYFVDILGLSYEPKLADEELQDNDNSESEEYNSIKLRIATNANHLLESWDLIPGTKEDGTIDINLLKDWIEAVITSSNERGYYDIAMIEVGKVLSYSPSESNGQWPCDAVCKIIEFYNNDSINLNFKLGIENQRGVTSRGLYDGGAQERVLVEKYNKLSALIKDEYPIVSELLNDIAQDYDREAKREDIKAEKNRIEYL